MKDLIFEQYCSIFFFINNIIDGVFLTNQELISYRNKIVPTFRAATNKSSFTKRQN